VDTTNRSQIAAGGTCVGLQSGESSQEVHSMRRIIAFMYGVAAYVVFLGTFLYAIGFVGNVGVPRSIDSGTEGSFGQALLLNTLLLALFAAQHSGMARQGFKQWWTKFVPQPIERSTYVLLSSLALLFLFWQWRPMGGLVWEVNGPLGRLLLRLLFGLGCGIVLVTVLPGFQTQEGNFQWLPG